MEVCEEGIEVCEEEAIVVTEVIEVEVEVIEVEAEEDVGRDVERADPPDLKARHDVVIRVTLLEVGVRPARAERQVCQVVQHEQREDHPSPPHGARGVGGLDRLSLLVVHRPRFPVVQRQAVGRVGVQDHGDQQDDPEDPQRPLMRDGGCPDFPQELGVLVEVLRPEVELEVSRHVNEHEAEQDDARARHDGLLAQRRSIEAQPPRHASTLA